MGNSLLKHTHSSLQRVVKRASDERDMKWMRFFSVKWYDCDMKKLLHHHHHAKDYYDYEKAES